MPARRGAVVAVAGRRGFPDPAWFSRLCRWNFGWSPSDTLALAAPAEQEPALALSRRSVEVAVPPSSRSTVTTASERSAAPSESKGFKAPRVPSSGHAEADRRPVRLRRATRRRPLGAGASASGYGLPFDPRANCRIGIKQADPQTVAWVLWPRTSRRAPYRFEAAPRPPKRIFKPSVDNDPAKLLI